MRRTPALLTCFVVAALLVSAIPAGAAARTVPLIQRIRALRVSRRSLLRTIRSSIATRRVPVQSSSRSSVPTAASRASTSPAGSAASVIRDTRTDSAVVSGFLVLGEVSPVLAGVRFFSTSEPISAQRIVIQLTADVPTLESILIYDENQRYLGLATHVAGSDGRYSASISRGMFSLPYKQSVSAYIRGRLKPHHLGGESGQRVEVSQVDIEGTGDWSNSDYVQSSSETFPAFETARGAITGIRNNGHVDGALFTGTNQLLSEFRFDASETDSEAAVSLRTLRFTIESSGNVTVANPRLQVEGADTSHACSISGSTVTCSSIPAYIGSLEVPRVIRVYGDATIDSGATNPFLRLTLNNPGTIDSSGDVSWTDGEAIFTWVPFNQPVARGTMLR